MADLVQRALYSMIQFTTITLLYSFASSLADFQARFLIADKVLYSFPYPVSLYRSVYHYTCCSG